MAASVPLTMRGVGGGGSKSSWYLAMSSICCEWTPVNSKRRDRASLAKAGKHCFGDLLMADCFAGQVIEILGEERNGYDGRIRLGQAYPSSDTWLNLFLDQDCVRRELACQLLVHLSRQHSEICAASK